MKLEDDEKNIDEFNKLFKEVKWMKKALDKELSQVKKETWNIRLKFVKKSRNNHLHRKEQKIKSGNSHIVNILPNSARFIENWSC